MWLVESTLCIYIYLLLFIQGSTILAQSYNHYIIGILQKCVAFIRYFKLYFYHYNVCILKYSHNQIILDTRHISHGTFFQIYISRGIFFSFIFSSCFLLEKDDCNIVVPFLWKMKQYSLMFVDIFSLEIYSFLNFVLVRLIVNLTIFFFHCSTFCFMFPQV